MARKTTEEFIKKAVSIHGDKYDYSKVKYTTNSEKVLIICPEHGEFWQEPKDHTGSRAQGCKPCGSEKAATKNRLSKEDFMERCNKVHDSKYDYSLSSYSNIKDKITIICPEHGSFIQKAESHMIGHGCSKCANRGFDKLSPGFLYYVKVVKGTDEYYKIGVTNKSIIERFKTETKVTVEPMFEIHFDLGYDAFLYEQTIIRNNINYLYKGDEQIMKSNNNAEIFVKDVLGMSRDAEGKLLKPEGFVGPEVKLQELLDGIRK